MRQAGLDLKAVHLRQVQVKEDAVGRLHLQPVQKRHPGSERLHAEPRRAQQPLEGFADACLVVHHGNQGPRDAHLTFDASRYAFLRYWTFGPRGVRCDRFWRA